MSGMKHFVLIAALALGLVAAPAGARAQNETATTTAVDPASRAKAGLEKHIKPILAALQLPEPLAGQVHDILAAHLQTLNAWHATNDTRIKPLWNQFNKARARQNEAAADAALAAIDQVYASLKPEHAAFLARLGAVLDPRQVATVKDVLTINKVEITMHAYGEIFAGLTAAQSAVLRQNLEAAREEAIDAGAMTEKSAFFKKYKIKIEAYLTAQGYNVKQCYRDFVARQKAAKAAGAADADK